MRDIDLFQLALGLTPPWMVADAKFDADNKRLDIEIDFKTGGRFACPECDKADCPVHDTVKKSWRHLNFFQHQAFLHARVPRIDCPEHVNGIGIWGIDVTPAAKDRSRSWSKKIFPANRGKSTLDARVYNAHCCHDQLGIGATDDDQIARSRHR